MEGVLCRSYSWAVVIELVPSIGAGCTYHEDNTAEISRNLQVSLGHFLTERDHHCASLAS